MGATDGKVTTTQLVSHRLASTRKVPHGSTHGSCIYLDSEDSDQDGSHPNQVSVCDNATSFAASDIPPQVDTMHAGQSSLMMALSKLNVNWSEEPPPPTASPPGYNALRSGERSSLLYDRSTVAAVSSASASIPSRSIKSKELRHPVLAGVTTTLMIRNIPLRFTPTSLRELVDGEGFLGHYDYCYMPMDFRSQRSLGYCFINFYNAESAALFAQSFDNHKFSSTNSEKVLTISAAARQGLLPNVASFKPSTLKQMPRPEFRPVVAILGQLFPLDEAVYTWLLTGTSDDHLISSSGPTTVDAGTPQPAVASPQTGNFS